MKILLKINWVLTILLSIATGVFKILQQEADIALFKAIGFTPMMTTLLGFIQLVGGLLMIFSRTRKIGAFVMIFGFIIASIAVFANGLLLFGMLSLVFIVMAYLVIYMDKKSDNFA